MSGKTKWEYCECGCHCFELRLGPAYYTMFDDLGKGGGKRWFHLNTGHHGHGANLGSHPSFEEADRVAREHAKNVLRKFRTELERAEQGI